MKEKIFRGTSAWYYSEDPDFFNEQTSIDVDVIEQVCNASITPLALLICKEGRYGIYFHIRSMGMGYGAVFENKMSDPFPFSDLEEMRNIIKETHPDIILRVLKDKVGM